MVNKYYDNKMEIRINKKLDKLEKDLKTLQHLVSKSELYYLQGKISAVEDIIREIIKWR